MKLFKCTNCGQPIYFENTYCEKCGSPLGFESEILQLLPLEPIAGSFKIKNQKTNKQYRYCSNYQYKVCNWLVDAAGESSYCVACALNRTIPDLNEAGHVEQWKNIEVAKHRLVYSLLRMKLPLFSKTVDEQTGLAFDFVADENLPKTEKILTGHDNGLITLNIAEADDISREMARKSMHEVYRTVLGHFRHEIAHYYWDRLILNTGWLDSFRKVFGDDRLDYAEALKLHYENGAPPDWNNNFISSYASTHPWEDWAETWAHYMHIIDTLETAYSFGLSVDPRGTKTSANLTADIDVDPYRDQNFETIFSRWLPLSFAMNSLNRSMGLKDLYPFVISAPVKTKMVFIHEVIRSFSK